MTTILLNGQSTALPQSISLQQFLQEKGYDLSAINFAVAINEIFVPRSQYAEIHIDTGDRVEIVSPMQGG